MHLWNIPTVLFSHGATTQLCEIILSLGKHKFDFKKIEVLWLLGNRELLPVVCLYFSELKKWLLNSSELLNFLYFHSVPLLRHQQDPKNRMRFHWRFASPISSNLLG
jgi:hypothetical protein